MSWYHYINKPEYLYRPNAILKRLFLPKEGTKVVMTSWGGKMEVNLAENIGIAVSRLGVYDLAVTEILFRLIQPGNFVLDIGANIGYTVLICSKRSGKSGKVLAFEPNPMLKKRLEHNVSLASYHNVTIESVALSDMAGEGELVIPNIYAGNEGTAFVNTENSISTDTKLVKINLQKLDNVLPEGVMVDVVKMDVEGHELKVLHGASKILAARRITNIVYEDHFKYPSPVSSLLISFGYAIYRIEKKLTRIVLVDPESDTGLSSWEPPNYLASLDKNIVSFIHKTKGYSCYKANVDSVV